ncbi:MAG: hypothetical protein OXI57_07550 [Rhodospirillales bacterium]|nr:hypothetical protein [Rhodospirillales bacterium]
MRTQEKAANRNSGQHAKNGNNKIWMRRGAVVALIAAVVAVTTTVVLIGGSEPANACFLGIPCW